MDFKQILLECKKDAIKLRIAIAFAVGCAVLLLSVFLFLLYKFVQRRRQSQKNDHKLLHKTASIRESDFSHAPQQRRHRPLMQTDSSASDVFLPDWRNGNMSPTSDSDEGHIEAIPRVGKLEFSVLYDTEKECLRVTVLSAKGLAPYEATTYVEIYLLPDRELKHQTKVHYKNCNPVYKEGFEFDVSFAELQERTLQFCLFSFDGFSRHKTIGEVFYSFDENLNLEDNTAKVLVTDIKKNISLFAENNPVRVGEVLVSLCYLPTSGRLTFVVLKARLSKKEIGDQLPNPFAKVSLLVSGRQVKKTRTSIVRKTLQPVYNEAFVFDIPVHRLSDVSLLVRVLHSEAQGEKDKDGKTIGKAVIGPDAKNSIGLHHWNCMMTSPRKPIAQWHPLMLS
ncbi:synaptotagmin-6-like isoform X2 [Actinia tenebrosa]|uniref:Synaptotagmin-6-like isoform X2 n=1 Tax=Actinia tenebrosa TaxID=6105 RepID=A0A6P8H6Y3_ACTTE|nr:synaptotagmin-6-like isoform X2 [Actinia tenebrosa]